MRRKEGEEEDELLINGKKRLNDLPVCAPLEPRLGLRMDVQRPLPDDEAAELLIELYKWQTRDEFVYRHVWEPNMVTMWDNRCVLHRATGGFEGFERLLHRTTIGYNPNVGTRVA